MLRRSRNRNTYSGSGVLGSIANAASGFVNKAVDLLPIELHIPGGYQYCGPGTKLSKRLSRGDPGINGLDVACKAHDIAYSQFSDNRNRSEADRVLAERAWDRVKASDSSLTEKAAAWMVTNIMKAKSKLGGGVRRRQKTKRPKRLNNSGKIKKRQKPRRKRSTTSHGRKKKGKGLYLKPYTGSGCGKKKKLTHRK